METKICTKCGEAKELDLFPADKYRKDGKYSQCKECKREKDRKWRLENPETAREQNRKWRLENHETAREIMRKWRLENRGKEREYERKRRLENPERAREAGRKWRRELKTGYVKSLLRAEFNIPASEIAPLDIKEKREQIQCHREIILLTKQLKES